MALDSAGERGLSPVQAQKSLFLLGKRLPADVGKDFYEFVPYSYGPFSQDIYDDVAALHRDGLVVFRPVAGRNWVEYVITEKGRNRAGGVRKVTPEAASGYLGRVVSWAQRQSFQALVGAIYKMYPEYRKNSAFKG
jgi:hypothetical protein